MQCRLNGFFDLKELQTAILEENGRISFLCKIGASSCLTVGFEFIAAQRMAASNLYHGWEKFFMSLLHSGKDEEWLRKQLSAHGCKRLSDIFLATGNQQNTLNVYFKK